MPDRNKLAENLQSSHSSWKFLQVNHSTYKFLQVDHLTCKFLQVNFSVSTRANTFYPTEFYYLSRLFSPYSMYPHAKHVPLISKSLCESMTRASGGANYMHPLSGSTLGKGPTFQLLYPALKDKIEHMLNRLLKL